MTQLEMKVFIPMKSAKVSSNMFRGPKGLSMEAKEDWVPCGNPRWEGIIAVKDAEDWNVRTDIISADAVILRGDVDLLLQGGQCQSRLTAS
jgi:hypothetical protein